MLYKSHLILGLLTGGTVSGCMHRGASSRSTEASKMKAFKVHKSCDIDAFLCQNELDFSFPQDIFSLQLPPPAIKQNQGQRQERQASLPERGAEDDYYYDPIGAVLNDMINFSMEMTSPVVIFSSSVPESSSADTQSDAMDKIMDDMLSSFFDLSVSSSNPTFIIERVNNHGRRLLQEENDPVRERLARRLSSVQYPHHHGRAHHMHSAIFNKNLDTCLWKRLQDRTLVSNDCSMALKDYATQSNASKGEYMLDPASLVVVITTFLIFTTTTLLLFNILLNSNIGATSPRSTMGKICASLPLLALVILLSYLSVTDPSFVVMVGTPVIVALGCYSCIVGDPEDEEKCDKCNVSTDSICNLCGACINCCECLAAPLVPSRDELNGDEVYVAVPAVI